MISLKNSKIGLLILIVFSSVYLKITAQDVDATYNYAVSSLRAGNFEEAIPNLRRVVFFAQGNYLDAYMLLGDAYSANNDKRKAIQYYKLAFDSYLEDSLKIKVRFRIIHIHLKQREPNYALNELYSLPENLTDHNLSLIEFYSSLAYFQLYNFEESRKHFLLAINNSQATELEFINSLFEEAVKNKSKNENVPMLLSIVPGLGQLTLKEYDAAMNSFFLSLSFSILYVYAFKNLPTIDAVLTVLPWFHRYYTGGILQAKKLAGDKKVERNNILYNKLIETYQPL